MLMKLIGSILIIASSSIIGYVFSRDCSKRPQDIRTLQGLLQIFENEISFLSSILSDAFEKVYRSSKSDVARFFKATVDNIRKDTGLNASIAWETAVRDNIKYTSLDKEDEEIIISFGKMLGNSDLEGQIKNIRLIIDQLKLQEQKAEENRKKNESMYRNLGVLAGFAIVIILF